MPLYDYDCLACGRRVEVVHGVHAPGPTHCPSCGSGPLKKAIVAPAVHFKGSGWAKRDRRATAAPGTAKAAGEAGASTEDGASSDADTTAKEKVAGSGPKEQGSAEPDRGTGSKPTAPTSGGAAGRAGAVSAAD
jgi:putative FmdB family regulatory protein